MAVALGLGATPQPQSVAPQLLGYHEWLSSPRGEPDVAAVDLESLRRDLARLDPAALPARAGDTAAKTLEYRRRLLTTFALEAAAVGSRRQAEAAARLVEWACPLVRSHQPFNAFDRAWQLAALSVLEGGINSQTLQEHVDHVSALLPDEPRLALARGIAEEQFNAPSEVQTRSETAAAYWRAREALSRAQGEGYRAAQRALTRFQDAAAKHPDVRPEAALRAGHVELRLGRSDAALAAWNEIDAERLEPALRFLLFLFRGVGLERLQRIDEARHAYTQALKVSPGAHSATMRLAALGFQYDRGATAARLLRELVANPDPRRDPWWSYYAGDWRYWYSRVERVRELTRADE